MKLTEQRLKQIIKEEVIKKLLEQDDFEDYKKMTRRDLLKKGATAAVGLAGIGGVSGLLKHYTDTDKEARAATRQDAAIEAYQKAYSLEEKIDDFNEYLNNVAAFRWGRGQETMMQIPGSKIDVDGIPRGITVLPPSYSLAVLAYSDKLNGTPKYGPPTDQVSFTENSSGKGAAESMEYFFDEFGEQDYMDANKIFDLVPGIRRLPAQGLERAIMMVSPEVLLSDPSYVLPENGMTVRDYYNWLYYNQFLSIDEVAQYDYESEESERLRSLLDSATPGQWKQVLNK